LREAGIIGHRVGLRPTRPQVRLEESTVDRTRLIHNYGHGGAGVTLSWGCAREVLALVLSALPMKAATPSG
jgi:D-amino-acid oxidase